MCGRCRCTIRPDDVPRACHFRNTSVRQVDVDRYRPAYNVSPGSYLPVLRRESGGDEGYTAAVHCMKWGLVPSFTKKDEKPDHYKMFNARSESIGEKASFRRLIPKNRCLVAVEGFYEWKKKPKKQPYYIHFKDNRPLVFAALYDSWKNSEDRMPVILGDEVTTDIWLNGSSDTKFSPLLKPYEKEDLIPLKAEEQSNPITKFFCKKGTDDNNGSNKTIKTSTKESTKNDLQVDVKEEDEVQASIEPSLPSGRTVTETKPDVSAHSPASDSKFEAKRDYQQLVDDSNPSSDELGKPPLTPVKKSKVKSGTEKQATLSSYFAKS
ncbi:Embryonic stem cell-specific 5-hydroxymethylcytosine-binding protein [Bienertia sinuspersici]